jgi:uncharacterized membrane protein (DUF373 family)
MLTVRLEFRWRRVRFGGKMYLASHVERPGIQLGGGGSMTIKILTLASELKELRSKWQTLSIYEKFEQLVVALLTAVIALIVALATWQLLLHALQLVESHLVIPADSQVFQSLFGMVLTVLIALEFKHTLLVVRHHRHAIVAVRAVVLVALLALVRRFILLDLYQTTPSAIAALAGAALALGIVFWLVNNPNEPQEVEGHTDSVKTNHLV